MNFSIWLKNELKKIGLSQSDFADMLRLDPSSISYWLSGDRRPKISNLRLVAITLASIQERPLKPILIKMFNAVIADIIEGCNYVA